MPIEQITHVRDVSAAWLTRALRESGRLRTGEVASVKVEPTRSVNATGARLTLAYTDTALGDVPSTLFLKVSAEATPFGDSEVIYYTTIASDMDDPPIPICYHAAYSQDTGGYHLLLQDLTGTHTPARNTPPTLDRAAKTVDAMAQLHAHWWDDERLASIVVPTQTPTRSTVTLEARSEGLPQCSTMWAPPFRTKRTTSSDASSVSIVDF